MEDVETGSQLEADVTERYQESFLDAKFESQWKIAKIQRINNDKLIQEFEGISIIIIIIIIIVITITIDVVGSWRQLVVHVIFIHTAVSVSQCGTCSNSGVYV